MPEAHAESRINRAPKIARLGPLLRSFDVRRQPLRIDHDVVVRPNHEIARRVSERSVSRPSLARRRFKQRCQRQLRAPIIQNRGRVVRRIVIDDNHFPRHALRQDEFAQALKRFAQQPRAIPRANGDGDFHIRS